MEQANKFFFLAGIVDNVKCDFKREMIRRYSLSAICLIMRMPTSYESRSAR